MKKKKNNNNNKAWCWRVMMIWSLVLMSTDADSVTRRRETASGYNVIFMMPGFILPALANHLMPL